MILGGLMSAYLCLVLGTAGLRKLLHPWHAAGGIRGVTGLSIPAAIRTARLIGGIELAVGACAAAALAVPAAAWVVVGMFVAISVYSFVASRVRPGLPCGCFGDSVASTFDYSQTVVALIFAAGGLVLIPPAGSSVAAVVVGWIVSSGYFVFVSTVLAKQGLALRGSRARAPAI